MVIEAATHHNTVSMVPLVGVKLLPTAKTCRTDVHAVSDLAHGVGAFYSYGMREVASAAVALDLQAGLVHSYYVSKGKKREIPKVAKEERAARCKETHFESPLAGTPSSDE